MRGFIKRLLTGKELPNELSYEEARAVLESRKKETEQELAGRSDVDPEVHYYLAERGAISVRRQVAANPATPAAANRLLARDSEEDVRAELAQKIGRLLPDLLASERERVCELTLETLRQLARDQIPRVRAILASEIKALTCVPRDVVLQLAHDVEDTVAVPILEYSPFLGDNDLLEVISSARAQGALAAVARRRGVSEKLAETIVASLDVSAVAALLANPNASIRENTLELVIDKAQEIVNWQEPLAMRNDLSMRALRRIAGFVGSSLLRQLTDRKGLDEETLQHLRHCLKHRLDRDEEALRSTEEKATAEVAALHRQGKLDEEYVLEAVEKAQRDIVMAALVLLAPATELVVEKIFSSRSPKAVVALVWKAGLSMRTALKIQTMLLKLHGDELLPARAGVGFPLSEDEMRWHLGYFGWR